MGKTAIFLGAGASKADGAPLQGELFYEYFIYKQSHPLKFGGAGIENELTAFFNKVFSLTINYQKLKSVKFPTFEEVLGLLDQALLRNESLINYEYIHSSDEDENTLQNNYGRLQKIRDYIILMMADIIHNKLLNSNSNHVKLCNSLKQVINEQDIIFVSTNYDILIDNALLSRNNNIYDIDYGFEFINSHLNNNDLDYFIAPSSLKVKLFKLHGSLNWLYCPTCNNVKITLLRKGIIDLIHNISNAHCRYCNTQYSPIIIPPTYFKNMNNVFISTIWNKAEQALREVEHIIFCGYSFPDADIHIKYLIKRIQTNRAIPLKFTVINNHLNKSDEERKIEKDRFNRFLGQNVNYTDNSFEEFAKKPMEIIK